MNNTCFKYDYYFTIDIFNWLRRKRLNIRNNSNRLSSFRQPQIGITWNIVLDENRYVLACTYQQISLYTVGLLSNSLAVWIESYIFWTMANMSLTTSQRLDQAEQVMAEYIQPTICIFGIMCNVLNLLVLTRPQLKESPYTYLLGLAVSDLSTLVMVFIRTVISTRLGKGVYGWQVFNAFIFLPFGNTFANSSIWITVFLTIERWISVKLPLKAKKICTKQLARQIIGGIVTVIFVFNIPRFFCRRIVQTSVNDSFEYSVVSSKFEQSYLYEIISWTHIICILVIPCLILTLLNTCLLYVVYKANRNRAELNGRNENNIAVHVSREQLRLTVTCASIICVFLVCVIPTAFSPFPVAFAVFGKNKSPEVFIQELPYRLLVMVTNILMTTNLSLNFVLYCLFNHKFYKTLKHMVKSYMYRICKIDFHGRNSQQSDSNRSYDQELHMIHRLSLGDRSAVYKNVLPISKTLSDSFFNLPKVYIDKYSNAFYLIPFNLNNWQKTQTETWWMFFIRSDLSYLNYID